MKEYHNYELKDFLADNQFVQWVLKPNPENTLFWTKWLERHPEKASLVQEASFMVRHTRFRKQSPNQAQLERVLGKVLDQQYSQRTLPKERSINWGIFLKVAAVLLLLAVVTMLVQEFEEPVNEIVPVATIIKENPAGQKSSFMLPDGTRVKLNAGSRATFPSSFGDSIRLVILEGEAFFEVQKDPAHPFIVQTGRLKVVALGTAFNVKAYAEDLQEKVALAEGKVRVSSEEHSAVLAPGQKADLQKDNGIFEIQRFDPLHELGWKDDKIVFQSTDFNTFTREIERWYGVKVLVEGKPAAEWKITGEFEDLSLELLMESVKFSKEIDYQLSSNELILKL